MSSSNSGSGSGDFPINITARDVGIDQVITKLNRFADVVKTLDAQIKASMNTMTSYNNLFTNFGRNFNAVNQGFNQGAQGAQRFNQAMQNNVNALRSSQSTLNQLINTQRQNTQATQQATAAQTALTQNIQRMNQTMVQTNAVSAQTLTQLRTLDTTLKALTTAVNQNAAATAANTARLQQHDTILRNVAMNNTRYNATVQQQNAAITQTSANVDKLTASHERSQQAIMSNVRGMTTLFMGFMMVNQSMVDFRLNQESMADLQDKIAETTARHAAAVERFGEESYMAQQALGSLEKAQRAVRYETREMANQIQNQIFLLSMIASNVMMEVLPAFMNWGETMEKLRGGMTRFRDGLAGIPVIFGSFKSGLTDTSAGVIAVTNEMSKFEKAAVRANNAGTTLSNGFSRLGGIIMGGGGMGLMAGLAAAAAGLAVYSTNAGGARDAVNSFGFAVGNLHPLLRMVGETLVGVAGAMGMTGETAGQIDRHFEKAGNAFEDFTDAWHDTLEAMKEDTNAAVAAIGAALDSLGQHGGSLGTALFAPHGGIEPDKDEELDFQEFKQDYQNIENMNSLGLIGGLKFLGIDAGASDEFLRELYLAKKEAMGAETKRTQMLDMISDAQREAYDKMDMNKPIPAGGGAEEARQAYLDDLRLTSPLFKTLDQQIGESTLAYQDYLDTMDNVTVQTALMTAGQTKYLENLGNEQIELKKSSAFLDTYQQALNQTADATGYNAAQKHEMVKGQIAQKEAFIEEQAALYQLQGQHSELYDQINKQNALDVAYRTGIWETRNALLERQKAVEHQRGAIEEMSNALNQGTLGQIAFNEGVNEQNNVLNKQREEFAKNSGMLTVYHEQIESGLIQIGAYGLAMQAQEKAALDLQVANAELAGTYDKLNEQLGQGQIQIDSYNKGFLEQQLALKNQHLALSEMSGALDAYNNSIRDGEAQVLAFTTGSLEMARAQAENFVALSNSQGALETYMGFIEAGIPQYNAFTKASQEAMMTIAQMPEVITGLIGNYEVLRASMDETETILQRQAIGYMQAKTAAMEWGVSLLTLNRHNEGTLVGLSQLAEAWGIHIPGNIKVTEASLKGLIEAFSNMEGAATRLASASFNMGMEMLSGVVDAIRDGGKEVNETIDEIEDRLGFRVPHGIKEAWESAALGQALAGTITEAIDLLQVAWATGNTEGVNTYMDRLKDRVKELWDDFTPEMRDIAEPAMNAFNELLSRGPDPNDPNGQIVYMNQLRAAASLIPGAIDPAAQSIESLNDIDLSQAYGTMEEYTTQIQNTARIAIEQFGKMGEAADDYMIKTNKLGQSAVVPEDAEFSGISLRGYDNAPSLPVSGKDDGSDVQATIDGAITSLDDLKAKADEVFQGIVSTAANHLGQLYTISDTTFLAIGESAFQVAVGVTTHYQTGNDNANGILATMQEQAALRFQAIGDSAFAVATGVTTHYNTAQLNAAGVLSIMEQQALQSFTNIGDYAEHVPEAVAIHFGKASADGIALIQALERASISAFSNMISKIIDVAEAMDSIGESAEAAERSVDSLRESVESLPNVTRTITYRIETVGSRPTGAQFGTNMLVDKPQMLLVGEGWGKERIKVSPGTMPFAEDFSREMNNQFARKNTINVSGQPGQPGTNANGISTNNGTSISTPGQPGANGFPGQAGQSGVSNYTYGNPNIYAPGYQHTNQTNNPDLGGGSTGMMINSNASLVQMNNSNGRKMIVDGKTGTVIMMDGSNNSGGSGSGSGSGSGNTNSSGDMVGQNNNVNIENDSNSKSNVFIPGGASDAAIGNNNNGVSQSQSHSQSGSSGQNYYYQSQTNNGQTSVNTNIPVPPGMVNQSAASSGNMPVSGSFSSDSRSRLLARGDPFGFQSRIVHETPVEVHIDLEGVKLAKKLIKILTEQFGYGCGSYG